MSANVRFHNHVGLGVNGWRLSPHNGNGIRVWDPRIPGWATADLPIPGSGNELQGVVTSAYIDDVPGQVVPTSGAIPVNTDIYRAYLKMDMSGALYVNWLPWNLASYIHGPEGFFIDARTQKGHLVGMAVRVPTYGIQGQYYSEWLLSYYNRGTASFFSHPAGSASAGQGWVACGQYVELLVWQDDWPKITGYLNLTSSVQGASLQVALTPNGNFGGASYAAGYSETAQRPEPTPIGIPGAPLTEGLWRYQMHLQTDAGTVTSGAVLNSLLDVHGKF